MTCSPFAIACQEWPDLNLLALTGKRPVEKNWSRWCSQPQAPGYRHGWAKSSIAYNVGVALGFNGLVAIDIDTDDLALIRSIIAVLPPIRAAKRGRRGFTAFFRDPTGNIADGPPEARGNPRTRHANGFAALDSPRHRQAFHLARYGQTDRGTQHPS